MLQNCPLPGEGTGVAQYLCGFKVKAQNGIYGTWTAFVFTMRRRAREDGRVLERLVAPPGTRLRFTSFWRRDKSPQASLGTNVEMVRLSPTPPCSSGSIRVLFLFIYLLVSQCLPAVHLTSYWYSPGFAFIATLTAVGSLHKIGCRPPTFKGTKFHRRCAINMNPRPLLLILIARTDCTHSEWVWISRVRSSILVRPLRSKEEKMRD